MRTISQIGDFALVENQDDLNPYFIMQKCYNGFGHFSHWQQVSKNYVYFNCARKKWWNLIQKQDSESVSDD